MKKANKTKDDEVYSLTVKGWFYSTQPTPSYEGLLLFMYRMGHNAIVLEEGNLIFTNVEKVLDEDDSPS